MARGSRAATAAEPTTLKEAAIGGHAEDPIALIDQGAQAFASAIIGAFTLVVRDEIKKALAGKFTDVEQTAAVVPPTPRVRRAPAPPPAAEPEEPEEVDEPQETDETPDDDAPPPTPIRRGRAAPPPPEASDEQDPEEEPEAPAGDEDTVQIDVESIGTMSRQELKPIAETLGINTQGMKADVMREEILKAAKEQGAISDKGKSAPGRGGSPSADAPTGRATAPTTGSSGRAPAATTAGAQEPTATSASPKIGKKGPLAAPTAAPKGRLATPKTPQPQEIADDPEQDWEARLDAADQIEGVAEFDSIDELGPFIKDNRANPAIKKHIAEMGCNGDCYNCAAYFQTSCFAKFNDG